MRLAVLLLLATSAVAGADCSGADVLAELAALPARPPATLVSGQKAQRVRGWLARFGANGARRGEAARAEQRARQRRTTERPFVALSASDSLLREAEDLLAAVASGAPYRSHAARQSSAEMAEPILARVLASSWVEQATTTADPQVGSACLDRALLLGASLIEASRNGLESHAGALIVDDVGRAAVRVPAWQPTDRALIAAWSSRVRALGKAHAGLDACIACRLIRHGRAVPADAWLAIGALARGAPTRGMRLDSLELLHLIAWHGTAADAEAARHQLELLSRDPDRIVRHAAQRHRAARAPAPDCVSRIGGG